MLRSIDETIALLSTDKGVGEACAEVESLAHAGKTADLMALAAALEERCPEATAKPRESSAGAGAAGRASFEAVSDHVEDQLALMTGEDAADALFALSLATRTRSVAVPRDRALRVRAFASRLGFGQSEGRFVRSLEKFGAQAEHRELLACWMHELVLRGISLQENEKVKVFQAALAQAEHPLAGLPLSLRPAEREAPSYMPLYGDKGLGRAIERLTSGPMSVPTIPPPADGAAVRATRQDVAEVTARLRVAVEPWAKIETKVFELDPAVGSGALGSWLLRALPLDSTSGVARLECARTGPEGVFGPLFSAASNGGAYSAGYGGAYGRRAAWVSLGALVGAASAAPVSDVDALAEKSTFLTFRAAGPWFHDVAWDLGALALRPDGRTAAVLAATDTD